MKNIYILPSNQPSRLVKIKDNFFITSSVDIPGGTFYNIHITNDEEIGEGDWCLNANKDTIYKKDKYPMDTSWDKIILTTDPTLIADGVQAIDDDFLKWFVKNPSCEFVEVYEVEGKLFAEPTIPQEEPKQIYYNTVGRENGKFVIKGQFNTQKEALDLANELNKKFPDLYYDWNETLIKEEPKQEQQKQHLINMMHDDEELGAYEEPKQETKCYCGHTTYCDCGPLEEPKQLTLEEAAERKSHHSEDDFIRGAKWQAERMYSEEEVIAIVEKSRETGLTAEYLLLTEQFKKK